MRGAVCSTARRRLSKRKRVHKRSTEILGRKFSIAVEAFTMAGAPHKILCRANQLVWAEDQPMQRRLRHGVRNCRAGGAWRRRQRNCRRGGLRCSHSWVRERIESIGILLELLRGLLYTDSGRPFDGRCRGHPRRLLRLCR